MHDNIYNVPVKEKVKYLAVIITKDQQIRSIENFNPIIIAIKKRFNLWLQCDLSLSGRSLITKVDGLSRLIFTGIALNVPKEFSAQFDKFIFKFIWKNKAHYFKIF